MKINSNILILTIIIISILLLEYDHNLTPFDEDGVSHRNILLILLSTSFLFYSNRNKLRVSLDTNKSLFLLFIFFLAITVFWSVNLHQTFSALTGILIGFVVALYLSENYKYLQLVDSTIFAGLVICFFSFILFIFNSDLALNPEEFFRFKGILNHSQRLSMQLSFFSLIAFIMYFHTKKRKYLISFIIFNLFIVSTFTRAWTTFYILTILLYVFNHSNEKSRVLYITFVIVIILLIPYEYILSIYQRTDSDITELTGRAALWIEMIPDIQNKFLLGHGFGSFREGTYLIFSWMPSHAHNMWLHNLYEIGLIGTILFNAFLIYVFYSVIGRKDLKSEIVKYLSIFILLASLTGVVIGRLIGPVYIIYLIFIFYKNHSIQSVLIR